VALLHAAFEWLRCVRCGSYPACLQREQHDSGVGGIGKVAQLLLSGCIGHSAVDAAELDAVRFKISGQHIQEAGEA
jgi:hypothetical protein